MMLRVCLLYLLLGSSFAMAQQGMEIFATQCQVCHGDGHGTERGPNLANNRRVRGQTHAQLLAVIRDGIPASGMPGFKLPAPELEAVANFVHSLSAAAVDSVLPGDVSAGEGGLWPFIYPRLLDLIRSHRSTIVFVNSRGLCERLSQRLNELAGDESGSSILE